jgi:IclR family KDG regulon transcriptional repressor
MNNTLIKGLRLLETLARRGQAMGVSELAAAAGLPKSGAHRLLQALVGEGYVLRQEAGSYCTSIKLWELGSAALSGFDLRRHADGIMEALVQATGETVHLSVLDRYEVVYVHKIDSANPVRAYTQIGGRAAAHCVAPPWSSCTPPRPTPSPTRPPSWPICRRCGATATPSTAANGACRSTAWPRPSSTAPAR